MANDEDEGPGKESVKDIYEGKAHPGTPLEPDELEPSPPEFSKLQGAREEKGAPAAHPTTELSSTPSHKAGKQASGAHPTGELNIRRRR